MDSLIRLITIVDALWATYYSFFLFQYEITQHTTTIAPIIIPAKAPAPITAAYFVTFKLPILKSV
jgi:hypothetical protein